MGRTRESHSDDEPRGMDVDESSGVKRSAPGILVSRSRKRRRTVAGIADASDEDEEEEEDAEDAFMGEDQDEEDDWCGKEKAVASALQLVRLLHTRCSLGVASPRSIRRSSANTAEAVSLATAAAGGTTSGDDSNSGSSSGMSLWVSAALDRKLNAQLEDPLSVVCSALPGWARALPKLCPFLFNHDTKKKLLRYTAFGPSFAVHWMQEAKVGMFLRRRATLQTELNAQTDPRKMQELSQELSNLEEHVVRSSHWLGTLQTTLARVRKGGDHFLRQSEMALERVSGSGHLLEVQFDGETGFGSAVTQSFYVEVSLALQDREANREVPLWVEDDNSSGSQYLLCRRGLLIRPLPSGPQRAAAVRRFRFLGRLMGQAFREGFIVPLPLAEEFFALVLGEQMRPKDFPRPGSGCAGELCGVLADFAEELAEAEEHCKVEGEIGLAAWRKEQAKRQDFGDRFLAQSSVKALSFDEYLSLVGACFLETGLSGAPLCAGGEGLSVTVENVGNFVEQASRFWFETGVSEQVVAFRRGLGEFLPVSSLASFRPSELRRMFCGEDRIDWEESSLFSHLRPAGGLTDRSPLFGYLVAVMVEMDQDNRARFLDFVSSCPRLPPGGLANFRLDVFPDSGSSSRSLPRSRACANQLYLPPYTSQEELRAKLYEAMHGSAGHHEQLVREL